MQKLFCPDLLETGPVSASLMAARDGMVNFFILKAPGGLVCIDTGWRPAAVRRSFDALALNVGDVTAVLLTHLHWDHARCVSLFAHANIYVSAREVPPFFMRKTMDAHPLAVRRVCGEQVLTVGGLNVRLVETPGHTPLHTLLMTACCLRATRFASNAAGHFRPYPGSVAMGRLSSTRSTNSPDWLGSSVC